MEPSDLNDEEMFALICLTRMMVAADGQLGVEEMAELKEIGLDLGLSAYTRLCKEVDELEELNLNVALDYAAEVQRPDARDLIRTMLLDLAGADGVDATELALIKQLTECWELNTD